MIWSQVRNQFSTLVNRNKTTGTGRKVRFVISQESLQCPPRSIAFKALSFNVKCPTPLVSLVLPYWRNSMDYKLSSRQSAFGTNYFFQLQSLIMFSNLVLWPNNFFVVIAKKGNKINETISSKSRKHCLQNQGRVCIMSIVFILH